MLEDSNGLFGEMPIGKEVKHREGLLPLGRRAFQILLVVSTGATHRLSHDGLVVPQHFLGDFLDIVSVSVIDASSKPQPHFVGVVLVDELPVNKKRFTFAEDFSVFPGFDPLDFPFGKPQSFGDLHHPLKERELVQPVFNAETVVAL